MFCELCVYPCPKDCIHMGTEYAFVSFDRSEFKHDLLSYKGMSREARLRMHEAEAKKAAKEAAKAAKGEGSAGGEDAAEEPEKAEVEEA
jgi:formate hydrogenlyase subunit 6/NADH:ubiquinone oxidoreductase subunit I